MNLVTVTLTKEQANVVHRLLRTHELVCEYKTAVVCRAVANKIARALNSAASTRNTRP